MLNAAQKAGDVPERSLCLLTVHIRSACDLRSTSGPETFGNSAIQCGGRQTGFGRETHRNATFLFPFIVCAALSFQSNDRLVVNE